MTARSYTIEGYTVSLEDHPLADWSCTCEDFKRPKPGSWRAFCKHTLAVQLARTEGREPQESDSKVVPLKRP